jgi:hypothetical protein
MNSTGFTFIFLFSLALLLMWAMENGQRPRY